VALEDLTFHRERRTGSEAAKLVELPIFIAYG
jgi:hypothetical protein